MAPAASDPHRPIHPDRKLDAFLGNMVANRRCEVDIREEYVILHCACPAYHRIVVLKDPTIHENYSERKIDEINQAFTCSRRS